MAAPRRMEPHHRRIGPGHPRGILPAGLRSYPVRVTPINWARTTADPRELPAYSVSEAAHYLRMPRSTIRAWIRGQEYRTHTGLRWFQPIILLPDKHLTLLSFFNLVEAHV